MKTPTIVQKMYAIAHHAKFGKSPLMSAIRAPMKAMSHPSYIALSAKRAANHGDEDSCELRRKTYVCDRDCRECAVRIVSQEVVEMFGFNCVHTRGPRRRDQS